MSFLPVVAALGSMAISGIQAIDSADANSKANDIANKQTQQEQGLIDEANQREGQANANMQAAWSNSAAASAIKKLLSKTEGFQGTVLGGMGSQGNPTQQKTLLGA